MSFGGFDPEILQDFLTECGELLEELEGDLVSLESSPNDLDLVNQVFRALHTIKGSASFLAMTNLVAIAHAAEPALNAARNGTIVVDAPLMDLLLAAVDTVKRQFEQLQAGDEMETPDANLVETLTAIGEGRQTTATAAATAGGTSDAGDQTPDESAAPAGPYGASSTPLELGPSKADLFEFLVADVDDTLERIDEQLKALADEAARQAASAELGDLCEALARSVEFFEFDSMARLVTVLNDASKAVEDLESDAVNQLLPLLAAAHCLIAEQTKGLHAQAVWEWPIDTFVDQIEAVIRDGGSDASIPDNATPEDILTTQGVWSSAADAQAEAAAANSSGDAAAPSTPDSPATPVIAEAQPADGQPAASKPEPKRNAASAIEQTIRVEVGRLESLMNLVGELVLQKNRVSAMSRKLATTGTSEEREAFAAAASELDRVTGDIQLAVMRTRMQPLEKLFGKYPRLIRDLAQKTGKKIELVIEGAETEVDKSVIEELGDPLVHVLRNSADHGVEGPEDRTESGKEALGTIKLSAANEGGVVKVTIEDDGKGLSREKIGAKALERGIVTETELATMSDREVMRFIFAAGFSTAAAVSDLSGRGVGMDVVRTNIEKLKGSVDVDSEPGKWTRITFTIPLTVAIMPAMMVDVSSEIYAVPLGSILEIVRPSQEDLFSIGTGPVMRLRDEVIPILNAAEEFDVADEDRQEGPFAVVLSLQERTIGLMVSGLIGQQEIVIKPLEVGDKSGPFSGTTVRDDGGVSLIVDIGELMRRSSARASAAPVPA